MYRKTRSKEQKKGMLSRVNLAYTGVAKHKFPFGDLRLSRLLPPLNVSALDTTYLLGPYSLADEHAALLLF